jgi:hypothetical protein
MTLHFDPATLVWDCFKGLETPDPAWLGDIDYWEGFNAAFFAANGLAYDPCQDSNVAQWVCAKDRASFTDMIAALAPRLTPKALADVDMVILAHWLPDLHLGSSVTNFAIHHLGLAAGLGFAISDRGLSAPLFAFDFAARKIASGRCRNVLLLVMDQKNMLYHDAQIAALAPDNIAAALVLGAQADGAGMAYRGYARKTGLSAADLPAALQTLRQDWGLGEDCLLIGPDSCAAILPDLQVVTASHLCAGPFVALSQAGAGRDAILFTWQFGTLTALGFAAQPEQPDAS